MVKDKQVDWPGFAQSGNHGKGKDPGDDQAEGGRIAS